MEVLRSSPAKFLRIQETLRNFSPRKEVREVKESMIKDLIKVKEVNESMMKDFKKVKESRVQDEMKMKEVKNSMIQDEMKIKGMKESRIADMMNSPMKENIKKAFAKDVASLKEALSSISSPKDVLSSISSPNTSKRKRIALIYEDKSCDTVDLSVNLCQKITSEEFEAEESTVDSENTPKKQPSKKFKT